MNKLIMFFKSKHFSNVAKYYVVPTVKICRSYEEILALDTQIDIHPSTLGAKLPEDFVDGSDDLLDDPEKLSRAMENIESWFSAVILRVLLVDTPCLASFINPTEDDVATMQHELNSQGGIASSWSDVMTVLDKSIKGG